MVRARNEKHTKSREVICAECSKTYQDYLSPCDMKKNHFCSRACLSIYMRKLKQKRSYITECLICKKSFRTKMCDNQKYCSRKCMGEAYRGRKCSDATKKLISDSRLGEKNHQFGKPRTEDERRRIADGERGEKSHLWKGGRTKKVQLIRTSHEYLRWRDSIYRRDNWTCQKCFKKGGNLHAHHIKPFSKHPELRLDMDNGMTMCKSCHNIIHNNIFGLDLSKRRALPIEANFNLEQVNV